MNVTGIILAGGKSSRMGSDKGLIKVENTCMVEHMINCLKKANVQDIIIIANNDEYTRFGFPVYKDLVQNKGPLGGILTALTYSKNDKNVILSCDMPFLNHEIIELLITKGDEMPVTTCFYHDRIHPLVGLYHKRILKDLKEQLNDCKYKVGLFIQRCGVKILDVEAYRRVTPGCFENINSQDDINRIAHGY